MDTHDHFQGTPVMKTPLHSLETRVHTFISRYTIDEYRHLYSRDACHEYPYSFCRYT